jgi:hypothetical protein
MALSVDKGFSSLTGHHPQVTLTTALWGGGGSGRLARLIQNTHPKQGSYPVHKGHTVHKCTKRNLAVHFPSNGRRKYADEPSRSPRSLPNLFCENPPRRTFPERSRQEAYETRYSDRTLPRDPCCHAADLASRRYYRRRHGVPRRTPSLRISPTATSLVAVAM